MKASSFITICLGKFVDTRRIENKLKQHSQEVCDPPLQPVFDICHKVEVEAKGEGKVISKAAKNTLRGDVQGKQCCPPILAVVCRYQYLTGNGGQDDYFDHLLWTHFINITNVQISEGLNSTRVTFIPITDSLAKFPASLNISLGLICTNGYMGSSREWDHAWVLPSRAPAVWKLLEAAMSPAQGKLLWSSMKSNIMLTSRQSSHTNLVTSQAVQS